MSDLFSTYLTEISSRLAFYGFKRRGMKFVRTEKFVEFVIKFQKSTKNSKEKILFSADFLVIDNEISRYLDEIGFSAFSKFQYRKRIAFFKYDEDFWWSISSLEDVSAAVIDIEGIVASRIVPEISVIGCPSGLIKMWELEQSPGLTREQRIISQAVFYKLHFMSDKLEGLKGILLEDLKIKNQKIRLLSLIDELIADI